MKSQFNCDTTKMEFPNFEWDGGYSLDGIFDVEFPFPILVKSLSVRYYEGEDRQSHLAMADYGGAKVYIHVGKHHTTQNLRDVSERILAPQYHSLIQYKVNIVNQFGQDLLNVDLFEDAVFGHVLQIKCLNTDMMKDDINDINPSTYPFTINPFQVNSKKIITASESYMFCFNEYIVSVDCLFNKLDDETIPDNEAVNKMIGSAHTFASMTMQSIAKFLS